MKVRSIDVLPSCALKTCSITSKSKRNSETKYPDTQRTANHHWTQQSWYAGMHSTHHRQSHNGWYSASYVRSVKNIRALRQQQTVCTRGVLGNGAIQSQSGWSSFGNNKSKLRRRLLWVGWLKNHSCHVWHLERYTCSLPSCSCFQLRVQVRWDFRKNWNKSDLGKLNSAFLLGSPS